ncbi:hypothetical protein NM208_g8188 [Fusarium decemcellulare]|uniref:Uncharacterized protein n=1 Tax=Fusarium decemcellulare TaxID=57161 RepID=A0ACC1S6J0_9HYPO|nr:hypothetical protein NM208_g8188 [Fusarium decemcellulare]
MLPPSLVPIYQQYKADTNSVASWLVSTAKAYGYPTNLLSPIPGRSSHFNRNINRNMDRPWRRNTSASAKQINSDNPIKIPERILDIKDYILLARFIRDSSKTRSSPPPSFNEAINRAIRMRSGFGSQMAQLGCQPDASADASHAYFVGVLEQVRDIMRPSPKYEAPKCIGSLSNRFSALAVE